MAIIAYYRFDGNSNDASGNGYNGTDTNISYSQANGKIGQGAGFASGSSSKIIANVAASNFGSGSRTISVLVYNKTTQTTRLFGNRTDSTTWFSTGFVNTNAVFMELSRTYPSYYKISISDNSKFQNNKWHLFTFIINGNNIYMYVDAVLVKQDTWTAFNTDAAVNAVIGSIYAGGIYQDFLNGNMDELKSINTAWANSEMKNELARIKGFF